MIEVLVVCVGVAFIGLFTAIGLAASRSLHEDRAYALEQAKRKREREILKLEVELGFRDPEEVRWRPAPHGYELDTARLSERDRETVRALLRHKRGAA